MIVVLWQTWIAKIDDGDQRKKVKKIFGFLLTKDKMRVIM